MNPHIYRILDANLNRSREALRILEDYARFHQNHSRWAEQFKTVRHALVALEEKVSLTLLLQYRDVSQDVGTQIQGTYEQQRRSIIELLRANFNRLKEAFRTLEEYSKMFSSELAIMLEEKRYLLYQLEQEILSVQLRKSFEDRRLYCLFSPSLCREPYLEVAKKLIEGGIQVLQLREKSLSDRLLLDKAFALKTLLKENDVLYLINDRPDLALIVEADGVHLGQEDLPLPWVRQHFPQLLIGVSTHTKEEALQASREGADYIGVGPMFPSTTKHFEHFAGLSYLEESASLFQGPRFAIGGIQLENMEEIVKHQGDRIALSSALLQAKEVVGTTRKFRQILDSLKKT